MSDSPPVWPVVSPWRKALVEALSKVQQTLLLVSPFLTDDVIADVETQLAASSAERSIPVSVRVLTRVRLDDLLNGANDLAALERLLSWSGDLTKSMVALRALDHVHAKVWVFDTNLAIVGSGNATASGLDRNVEYGLAVADPTIIAHILADWQLPWEAATTVTADLLMRYRNALERVSTDEQVQEAERHISRRRTEIATEMQVPIRLGKQLPSPVKRQQQIPPLSRALEPSGKDGKHVPDQKEAIGTLTDAVWASAQDLWQALRWTVPLTGENYTLHHLESSAGLKLSWRGESNSLHLAWADGHRLSVATISAHLHEASGELAPISWAVVLDAESISLLTARVHRLVTPGQDLTDRQDEVLICRGSPKELIVAERGERDDQIMASSLRLPATSSIASTAVAPLHPPVASLVIEHPALQEAITQLDQAWIPLRSQYPAEPSLPPTIGLRLDGQDTANLTCFVGSLNTRTAVEIPAGFEAFRGPAVTLHLDQASLRQVLASAGNDVVRWKLSIGSDAERIQFVPKDTGPNDTASTPWCHELYIVE